MKRAWARANVINLKKYIFDYFKKAFQAIRQKKVFITLS